MINLSKCFILMVFLCDSLMCSSKILLEGVSNICRTAEGRMGRCTSRTLCHHAPSLNRTAAAAQCPQGMGKRPYVCCAFGTSIVFPDEGDTSAEADSKSKPALRNLILKTNTSPILFPDADGNFHIPSRNKKPDTFRFGGTPKNVDLLPKPQECGPTVVGHKIYEGEIAELGEFPWLVNLEYRTKKNESVIGCAGSIINHRFILTAAHCVRGQIEDDVGKLESLRAGDHNILTDEDCDGADCIPPYKRYIVTKHIIHENYTTDMGRAYNDIALLKVDPKISYSDTIAPICLPDTVPPMPSLRHGVQLTVAGWGADGKLNEYLTSEKRIANVPYYPKEECTLIVQNEQICAGGFGKSDTCKGDSGGSLCRLSPQGWYVEGIVSYGRGKCGNEHPSIYTKVRSFLPWIHTNVDED